MKTLYRTRRKKESNLIPGKFFVLDVETFGENIQATPDKFVFGCIYGENYKKVFYSVDAIIQELETKKFRHKYIFAHNAEFDFSVVYGNIKKNLDNSAVFNGRFILAKKGTVYFADSMNIFKTSVKVLGKNLGIEKGSMEYYKTRPEKITIEDIDYCFRDCEIVYKSLLGMFNKVGSVKPTLAGCALMMFRNYYQPYHIVYNETLTNEFFESYYGGRVECFKIGATNSSKYDVNSMYPYSMVEAKFPNPAYLKKIKKPSLEKLKYLLKHYEGCAKITVNHKKTDFGFLPLKHNKKLIFPAGKFSGCWNFNELRLPLKMGVIEITNIEYCIYSNKLDSPFVDYVNTLYDLRKKSTGIDNLIYKNLLNNLYGKFAQREKFKETYFETLPLDTIAKLEEKKIEYEVIYFNSIRLDGYIKQPAPGKNHLHTIALFSSYITSYARTHLLKYMLKYKANQITYLDTDCIALEKPIENFVDSLILGGFKLEKDIITEILGNKSYNYKDENDKFGKKLKGIVLNNEKSKEIRPGVFQYQKLIKTKEAIRRNIVTGMPVLIEKKLSINYDKRTINKSGFTKILKLET